MSAAQAEKIVDRLVRKGRVPDTPDARAYARDHVVAVTKARIRLIVNRELARFLPLPGRP